MLSDDNNSLDWQRDGTCASPDFIEYRDYFFSEVPEEIEDAKEVCSHCPVRSQCLAWALNNKEIWGVWGGKDENEIRDALSISEEGQEVRRTKEGIAPTCLNCGAKTEDLRTKEVDIPGGGRWTTKKVVTCSSCDFYWTSRTSANAIEAYMALQAKIKELE